MASAYTCPMCFSGYTEKKSLKRHFDTTISCSVAPNICASCNDYTPKDALDYFRHYWDCIQAVASLKRDYSFSSAESYEYPRKSATRDWICESTSGFEEYNACGKTSPDKTEEPDEKIANWRVIGAQDLTDTDTPRFIAANDEYENVVDEDEYYSAQDDGVGGSLDQDDGVDGSLDVDDSNDTFTSEALFKLLGQSTAYSSISDNEFCTTYDSTYSSDMYPCEDELSQVSEELSQVSDSTDDPSIADIDWGQRIRDLEDSILNRYSRMQSANLHPAEEELFTLLTENNLPPKFFDIIMTWAHTALASGYKFESPHRSTCLKRMMKAYAPYVGSPPKKDTIHVDNLAPIHIYRLNFEDQARRVYSDPHLMEGSLWSYDFRDETYGDLNTGLRWKEAEQFVAARMGEPTLPEGHYLAPVLLFDDETMTDGVGRLKARPIACSFGNINLSHRKSEAAWFLLSVIPPFPKTPVEKTKDRKADMKQELQYLTHYHKCLEIVTTELHEVCSRINGTEIYVHGKGVVFLHFELFMIIGDTDGHDAMCCHYAGYSTKLQRMCRDCDVSYEDCDYPAYECMATKKSFVKRTIDRCLRDLQDGSRYSAAKKRGQQISQHMIHSTYYRFAFGGNDEGIHGALPFEILHVYYLGLMKYLLDFIYRYSEVPLDLKNWYDLRIQKKAGGELDKKPSLDNSLRNATRTKFRAAAFESRFRQVMGSANRQSDRSMPRMPFKNGVTCLTRLTGQEYPGLCLLTMVCLESLVKLADHETAQTLESNMATLLWLSLSIEKLLTQDTYKEHEVNSLLKKLTKYLEFFQRVTGPWREMMSNSGLRLVKFHAMKHFPRQIRNYGSPHNFSGVYLESALKQLVKQPTKRTTRQHSRYEYDLLLRHYERLIVRCSADRQRFVARRTEQQAKKSVAVRTSTESSDLDSPVSHVFPKQPKFCLVKNGDAWYTVEGKTKLGLCHPHLADHRGQQWVEALVKTAEEVVHSTYIECFYHVDVLNVSNSGIADDSESLSHPSKAEHVTFRCHPNYRSHPYENRGWFDWAVVQWESNGLGRTPRTKRRITSSEVRLCLFANMKRVQCESVNDIPPTKYAVCQALTGNKRDHHLLSVLQVDEIEDDVRCIPIETLKEVAYVLPACPQLDERFRNEVDDVKEEEIMIYGGHPLDHKLFLIIPPRSTWGNVGWGKLERK